MAEEEVKKGEAAGCGRGKGVVIHSQAARGSICMQCLEAFGGHWQDMEGKKHSV